MPQNSATTLFLDINLKALKRQPCWRFLFGDCQLAVHFYSCSCRFEVGSLWIFAFTFATSARQPCQSGRPMPVFMLTFPFFEPASQVDVVSFLAVEMPIFGRAVL